MFHVTEDRELLSREDRIMFIDATHEWRLAVELWEGRVMTCGTEFVDSY